MKKNAKRGMVAALGMFMLASSITPNVVVDAQRVNMPVILRNGDFENGTQNVPANWRFATGDTSSAQLYFEAGSGVPVNGVYSKGVAIEHSAPTYSGLSQSIRVEPGKEYELTAYIKGNNIKKESGQAGGDAQAQLVVDTAFTDTDNMSNAGNFDWQKNTAPLGKNFSHKRHGNYEFFWK